MRGMAGLAEVFTEMHRAEIKSKGKMKAPLFRALSVVLMSALALNPIHSPLPSMSIS